MVSGFRVPASNGNEMKSHVAAATVSPQDQWTQSRFASPRMLEGDRFSAPVAAATASPQDICIIRMLRRRPISVPHFLSMIAAPAVVVSVSALSQKVLVTRLRQSLLLAPVVVARHETRFRYCRFSSRYYPHAALLPSQKHCRTQMRCNMAGVGRAWFASTTFAAAAHWPNETTCRLPDLQPFHSNKCSVPVAFHCGFTNMFSGTKERLCNNVALLSCLRSRIFGSASGLG